MPKRMIIFSGIVFIIIVLASACTPKPIVIPTPTIAITPTHTPVPTEIPPTPTPDPKDLAESAFVTSAHANPTANAFTHWDLETEIPMACAKCHSIAGFQDFALDGKVDVAAPVPNPAFDCLVCHSDAVKAMSTLTFPSGSVIKDAGPAMVCMNCHQGRQSKPDVDAALVKFGEALDPDAIPAPYKDENGNDVVLGFMDIHYAAAGAAVFGSEAKGGYQYNGNLYDIRNPHTEIANSCSGCHDPHSLQLKLETCSICHINDSQSVESIRDIREIGSSSDHDGDGNTQEGIYYEIKGLQEILYSAIQTYAREVLSAPIVYDADHYPYWFADNDDPGNMDETEKTTAYAGWTPRLLKAAYNYQVSIKDGGAFAHGGKYVIELLYDSIKDLNASEKLITKTDMSGMAREDPAHFDGAAAAWRHWDKVQGEAVPYMVTGDCAQCHTGSALSMKAAGETIPETGLRAGNGLMCSTCHDQDAWPDRYRIGEVTLASGKAVSFGNGSDSNLCLVCHQGRSSKSAVDAALAEFNTSGKDDATLQPIKDVLGNEVSFNFTGIMTHYLPVAGVLFGTEAQVAYEYEGKSYIGLSAHAPVDEKTGCAGCHDMHSAEVKIEVCQSCHTGITTADEIRNITDTSDWNGNGDNVEGLGAEYLSMRNALYTEILKYAKAKAGKAIVFNPEVYPYWFTDTNGDGKASAEESQFANAYATWTPRLVKAVYNYNFFANKNPGAGSHNGRYSIQVIYDSIEDLGGNVSKYTRP